MIQTRQPKLKVPRSQTESILEFMSGGVLLFLIILLFQNWERIPDSIPTHFGASGKPNSWGSKYTLLLLPSILIIIYSGFTILSRYPHVYNYPWQITEENAERQYLLARTFLSWLKLEIILLFTFIEWTTIQVALGYSEGLGFKFLPISLIVVFGTIGIYFWLAYKAR
jgi:uncharacterized membrane protein